MGEGHKVSSIRSALSRLDNAVSRLEGSIDGFEGALSGKQRDMFVAPSNQNGSGAAIAKRLDLAIEKVEELLEEGQGGN